jgi:thiol-disulfide isomerase/thioredoxin
VRAVPCLLTVAVLLNLSGCAVFKKQAPANKNPPDPLFQRAERANPVPASDQRRAAAEPNNPIVPTSTSSGILAGQVKDAFGRPVPEAWILVSLPKKSGKNNPKPLDVPTKDQGYFTIQGLAPGQDYQLTARARDGNHMLAGITWATAPNPRVLITVREDFVSKNTPPIPPPPDWPRLKDVKAASAEVGEKDRATAAVEWAPGPAVAKEPRRQTDPIRVTPATEEPRTEVDASRIAKEKKDSPPLVDIGRRPGWGPPGQKKLPPPSDTFEARVSPASRVPSCVLVGKQLKNFALYDLDNRVWEFRKRRGKVVLLDFWGTKCIPCRKAVPHLKLLQEKYGSFGLEVIGIACEGGSAEKQRQFVDLVCQNEKINYKVLMGGGDNCPVMKDFNVRLMPTIVLLDENGWILEKHVGLLTAEGWQDLEMRIKRWLGVPE